jgi:hypothetical protein
MKPTLIVLGLAFTGCATYTPMRIVGAPPDKTDEQRRADDVECSRYSSVHGPWAYGIGTAIMRDMSVKRYTECMNGKGYKVEKQ